MKHEGKARKTMGAATETPQRGLLTDERFTKLLYAHAIDPILIADRATGVIIDCNATAEAYFGYPREQLVGMDHRQLHAPEDIVDGQSISFGAHRVDPSRQLEARLKTATGEIRFASIKATGFEFDGKECMMGVFRDITDIKMTEDALNKRLIALTMPLEEQDGVEFEDLFDLEDIQNLQDAFCEATRVAAIITHPDGSPITRPSHFCRFCTLIRATCKGKGNCYLSDSVIGRKNPIGPVVQQCLSGGLWDAGATITVGGRHIASWLIGQVRDEAQTDGMMAAYARSLGMDEQLLLDAFHDVPAMSKGDFERIAQFLFSLAGKLSSIAYQNVMQARSIVEMKKVREELLTSVHYLNDTKSLLAAVLEQSPIPMLFVDAKTGVVQVVNPACRDILGAEADAPLEGENIRTLRRTWKLLSMAGQPFAAEEMPLYMALQGKRISDREVRIIRRDGTERIALLNGVPIFNDANDLIAGLVVLQDITSLRKAEEVMVQTEKMMSIGGVAAGMAHEINNPLGIILASVQNAERRVSSELQKNRIVAQELGVDLEKVRAYLEQRGVVSYLDGIGEAAQRAAKIVKSMLDFSRLSESVRAPHNVNALLDTVIDLAQTDYDLKKNYDFRQIDIVRKYAGNLPEIMITKTEIEQVFLNLVKNAAYAMTGKAYGADKPRIVLRTALVDNAIVIEVEDNGPGMDEGVRKRIFEPFYTTKTPGQGTGLGLSISYFIITQNHKGSFTVASVLGQGTTFTLTLPLS
ncbi:MAG: PocR ligand-binding domain-containing protein [Desulfovibrionaceae bacterium]